VFCELSEISGKYVKMIYNAMLPHPL